jgi:glycerol-3-phosphate dehydrogenase (NAD(P)+)
MGNPVEPRIPTPLGRGVVNKIAIIGAGVWGSALSYLASQNGHQVYLWSRRSQERLEDVFQEANIVLSAVSMSGVSVVVEQLKSLPVSPGKILITATKGLDAKTTRTPSQIWQAAFPANPVVVLSGPNLSKEIGRAHV